MTDANAPRELYRRAGYRIVAWVERPLGRAPALYVRLERLDRPPSVFETRHHTPEGVWHHVRTTEASLTKAPWWRPWIRKHELQAVVAREIAFIEQQEDLEASAAATLEAVAEAMQLIDG